MTNGKNWSTKKLFTSHLKDNATSSNLKTFENLNFRHKSFIMTRSDIVDFAELTSTRMTTINARIFLMAYYIRKCNKEKHSCLIQLKGFSKNPQRRNIQWTGKLLYPNRGPLVERKRNMKEIGDTMTSLLFSCEMCMR